jgi:hypothetical protein
MSDPDRLAVGQDRATEAVMNRRIEALEKGIQRWRCLTAAGFLTALGAFGLAVFGLSQFENTLFIGEMAPAQVSGSPLPVGVELEGVPAPGGGGPDLLALALGPFFDGSGSGFVGEPGNTSPSVLTDVQGETLAATDGGS